MYLHAFPSAYISLSSKLKAAKDEASRKAAAEFEAATLAECIASGPVVMKERQDILELVHCTHRLTDDHLFGFTMLISFYVLFFFFCESLCHQFIPLSALRYFPCFLDEQVGSLLLASGHSVEEVKEWCQSDPYFTAGVFESVRVY
jgi:hypothetical protein